MADYAGGESDGSAADIIDALVKGFEDNLDDDLNISGALGCVFDFIRDINRLKDENKLSADERDLVLKTMRRLDTVLNFEIKQEALDADIEAMIAERNLARKNKDYARSDQIRDELLALGIILEDTPQGVKWKRKA